jgi:hypothetical protein
MVFGFVAYDVTLLAMTEPTDSLMTDWMTEADMLVVVFVFVCLGVYELW